MRYGLALLDKATGDSIPFPHSRKESPAVMQALKRTALYQTHLSLHARMVPFAGWEMPVQYNSILAEARAVRTKGGIFDVSHMSRIYISGPHATNLLDWVQTGNIRALAEGRARYSLICNEKGGIIDDTITYRLGQDNFLLVCNASNRNAVLDWLHRWREERYPQASIDDATLATVMIALQGPTTSRLLGSLCPQQPSVTRYFSATEGEINGSRVSIGRTGYTGEDGFELILEAQEGPQLWGTLMDRDMVPCGLGARDVLRLEAGLVLHGNDIDTSTSPLEAGLERFVCLEKEFAGAPALRRQQERGVERKLVGLLVEERSIPRHNYTLLAHGKTVGRVTSGSYSPTLDRNIAMGYVSKDYAALGQTIQVDIRGRATNAMVTSLPFYVRKRNP